jgi:hypothetical protein
MYVSVAVFLVLSYMGVASIQAFRL